MSRTRRSRLWFFSGVAVTIAAVILWAAYIFTAIWLRVRCGRELANRAQPLGEVQLDERFDGQHLELNSYGNIEATFTTLGLHGLRNGADSLSRLEALQHPSIATVLRLLLRRAKSDDATELLLGQTFYGQVRFLTASGATPTAIQPSNEEGDGIDVYRLASGATSTAVQLSDGQVSASQSATLDLTIAASSASINSGQGLTNVIVWDSGPITHYYSVTDSAGDKLLVVSRPAPREESDSPMEETNRAWEVLLIDSAGRILERSTSPGRLLGKLAEPRGKADQLVFGTPGYVSNQNATFNLKVVGPGAVCIIDDGRLKTMRTINPRVSSDGEPEPAELKLSGDQ